MNDDLDVDVAIIGGGFTGLSAALNLAENGVNVAVFEAKTVGWGASGRNGGFCCLGGGIADDDALDQRFGRYERLAFRGAEKAAVDYTAGTLKRLGIEAETHSKGETVLAHRPRDAKTFKAALPRIRENYGVDGIYHSKEELNRIGMEGPFFGGLTVPIGFGLNPAKYLSGLHDACLNDGAQIYQNSPVRSLKHENGKQILLCNDARIKAAALIIATNGYSQDDVATDLKNCVMPGQSSVLVTRPLTADERMQQGWTSDQMCYDTRNLLHYFRLMPDKRFLFGMRGGLLGGAGAEARSRTRLRAHFHRMFPKWGAVEITNSWSGLVALARNKLPFVGRINARQPVYAALCYHGNGVAMAGFCGKMISDVVLKKEPDIYPRVMQIPMKPFPLGSYRRLLMPPLYAALHLQDL